MPAQPEPPQLGLSDILALEEKEHTELDKILELLLDPQNIEHNSDLNKNEILAFSVLATLANRHNLPVLQQFLKQNLLLRVSKNRKGREEWVKILSRQLEKDDYHNVLEGSRFGRMFRRPPDR